MSKPFVKFKLCWPYMAKDEPWGQVNFSIRPQGVLLVSDWIDHAGNMKHAEVDNLPWFPIVGRYRAPEAQ